MLKVCIVGPFLISAHIHYSVSVDRYTRTGHFSYPLGTLMWRFSHTFSIMKIVCAYTRKWVTVTDLIPRPRDPSVSLNTGN